MATVSDGGGGVMPDHEIAPLLGHATRAERQQIADSFRPDPPESIEERVGRAAHERWKLWIVESGYADHAWDSRRGLVDGGRIVCAGCAKTEIRHHPDMVPWEELPEEKRGKYIGQGMAGYEIGLAERQLP